MFREGHAEFLYDFDACTHFYNQFVYYYRAELTMVSGTTVERYWQSAMDDMYEKRLKDVLCPCQKCKGIVRLDPFEGGTFKAHLLMHGFMHGHTRWISEDDDDEEDVDRAGNNDMGPPDEEITDYVPEEEDGLRNVDGEEAVQGGEDTDAPPSLSLLSSAMQDPHVRDLLCKKTTSELLLERRPNWRNWR